MNARKARAKHRALRKRNEQLLAAMRAAVPERLRTTANGYEVWRRGPATIVVPAVPLHYPEPVQTALTAYRMAALTSDCPRCALGVKVTEAGAVMFRHEVHCPADPDRLAALAAEHGIDMTRKV
ncbi:hypothetical protein NGM36_26245 [Streptomyces mutabilis]|uniref:hypothetical protein n=1 Tax=Streptomyces mutabilis TaxID=67332 RepID=UPI0022BA24BD|nr:hypothetical protein [Streptomyces mutabilis]MCZ9353224.1 hypothetical protein [Streptomyces mutabilis]